MNSIDKEFINRVKEMIRDDDTEEVIDVLLEFFEPMLKTDYYDELIGHSSQLNRLNKRKRKGLLTDERYNVSRNQANQNLIDFINDVYRRSRRKSLPSRAPATGVQIDEETSGITKEKIVGKSEFRDVIWLQRGMMAAKSVCKIKLADGSTGTGFMLKNNLLLTNYHVLEDADIATYAKAIFHFEEDMEGNVNSKSYSLDPASFFENDSELDFALVKVKEQEGAPPLSDYGCLNIEINRFPEPEDYVSIIQHPAGETKKLAFDRVDNTEGFLMRYKADTLKGSSGSPVFDANWNVVALHHSFVDGQELNQGTLLSAINEKLNGVLGTA
ncbi:MAG: trypsin-like peptidase domain-containing protein [Bacteroidetes bacterium]|nr:trypsin-like peptidase domain-containing protein [Bacteroidota bacterium]